MNSIFILAISIVVFGLGYAFYSRWLGQKVLSLDDSRPTPAQTLQDGKDYVPTSRWTTFFYHFATISGSGVLVGPTLAAQYGWLPCLIWILAATCLAGGVHDMVVLAASVRNGAKSIAQIALAEVGPVTGTAMMIAIIFMVTTAMAGFGLGAVAAMAHNPWGTFAIAMSIPIALFIAAYLRWIRPGRVVEASLIGVAMLVAALLFGGSIPETRVGRLFDLDRGSLTIALAIYGFVAAALPVGILVRPRDYLSAFIKIGVVVLLFAGIAISMPKMQMPAISGYVSGDGPVISGSLWPFLFIIITCGAISGWHALCCSGVTPKLISKESHIRPVAYGGWLLESCCAILALILAGMLLPADYYAINAKEEAFARTGLSPQAVVTFQAETGINVAARTGGPASLAFSMTNIFARLSGGLISKSQLYQFFILFLGLFIVAVMDHGTRMSRYFIQELASKVKPSPWSAQLDARNYHRISVGCIFVGRTALHRRDRDALAGFRNMQSAAGVYCAGSRNNFHIKTCARHLRADHIHSNAVLRSRMYSRRNHQMLRMFRPCRQIRRADTRRDNSHSHDPRADCHS